MIGLRLSGKPLSDITAEDIFRLIKEEVPASRTLDYKLELTEDNKELLADIIAFANTDGGIIVYGIEEKKENGKNTGVPFDVTGLTNVITDQVSQRIENVLRDNVEPRLQNVEVRSLNVNEKVVLLVGVPRSLFAPHMLRKDNKFYARNSAGKFAMDVHQIRDAFLQTADWEKQADNFRRTRVMEFLAEKVSHLRQPERAILLHVVPLGVNRSTLTFRGDLGKNLVVSP
ncbi:hypothetical protein SD51_13655 [Alicyclobacillus tengchongensis]|nr:hypothetical protein SD51_13655 [Alicyclobacillus tengchongensis]